MNFLLFLNFWVLLAILNHVSGGITGLGFIVNGIGVGLVVFSILYIAFWLKNLEDGIE